jgi:hypothetical protein
MGESCCKRWHRHPLHANDKRPHKTTRYKQTTTPRSSKDHSATRPHTRLPARSSAVTDGCWDVQYLKQCTDTTPNAPCTNVPLRNCLANCTKHTCCELESCTARMCSRAVPDLYFIGQRCKTVRVLMNRRRGGRQKKTLCPAPAAEKGAANITHRAYITKGVTGGTALLGAGGKKQQRRTAAACTCLHAPVRTPPPPSHHDDHHNSCRAKQERGDTSLSAPASSPELLGTPARTSTLAHSMIPQKSRSRRVNQQTNK